MPRVRELETTPAYTPASQTNGRRLYQLRSLGPRVRLPLRFALIGLVIGTAWAFLAPTYYESSASILPENRNRLSSQLSGAAALLGGLSGGLMDGGTSPQFYAELFRSRSVLNYVVTQPFHKERGSRAQPLEELLVRGDPSQRRTEDAIKKLRELSSVDFDSRTGIVTITALAATPTLAHDVVDAFVRAVSEFDLSKRQSRAKLERQFIESRVHDAQQELQAAEDNVRQFLSANRGFEGSPGLKTVFDRLQREVQLKQDVYVNAERQLEDARVQEVRDTPVFSVIDTPSVPTRRALPKRRVIVLVAIFLGAIAGLGVVALRDRLAVPGKPADSVA